jgi:tRNA (cmo5U34)-methyltransferase
MALGLILISPPSLISPSPFSASPRPLLSLSISMSDRQSIEIFPVEVFADNTDFDRGIRQLIPYYDEMLSAIARCIPSQTNHILELGCGTGELSLKLLESFPQATIIALDYSPRMIERARQKTETAGYQERWQGFVMDFGDWASGKEIGASIEQFDVCVSSLAIHHLVHSMKLKLFERIKNSLKTGGSFWNADPVMLESSQLAEVYEQVRTDWMAQQGTTIAEVRTKMGTINPYGYSSQDQLATLEAHLQMLKIAGFDSVAVPWKYYGLAVFGAYIR